MNGGNLDDLSDVEWCYGENNKNVSLSRGSKIVPSASGLYYPSLRVEVKDQQGIWWPAYIIKIEKCRLLISYEGWDRRWDRWIDSDNDGIRVSSDQKPMPPELSFEYEGVTQKCNVPACVVKVEKNANKNSRARIKSQTNKMKCSNDYENFDLSYYACKPRKSLVPIINCKVQKLRERHGINTKIVVEEVKNTKFKVFYTTKGGNDVCRWIFMAKKSLGAKKPLDAKESLSAKKPPNSKMLPSAKERSQYIINDNTVDGKVADSYEHDRYLLLSAAGVKLRAAANPIARMSFQERVTGSVVHG